MKNKKLLTPVLGLISISISSVTMATEWANASGGVVSTSENGCTVSLGDGSGIISARAVLASISVTSGTSYTVTADIKANDANTFVYLQSEGVEVGGAYTSWTSVSSTFTATASTTDIHASFWKQQPSTGHMRNVKLNGVSVCGQSSGPTDVDVVITKSGDTDESGSMATLSVTLNEAPTGDITLTAASSDTSEGQISGNNTLVFTSAHWNTAQQITVAGQSDNGQCDGNVTYNITLSGTGATSASISLINTDLDDCSGGGGGGTTEDNTWYQNSPIHIGTGAWVYDSTFPLWSPNSPDKAPYNQAGLFANALTAFNQIAGDRMKINQVFNYGGGPEMYCRGSGESSVSQACNNENTVVLYGAVPFDKNKTVAEIGATGMDGTNMYGAELKVHGKQTNYEHVMIPTFDGRLDANTAQNNGSDDILDAFKTMTQDDAIHLADKTAKAFCADGAVTGVQFDIEPFRFIPSQPGQIHYYTRIADVFAGKHTTTPNDVLNDEAARKQITCVTAARPYGLSWSVFTFPQFVNQELADVMNEHNNGYVVISGYDLGNLPGGQHNTPSEYRTLIKAKIIEVMNMASTYNVRYQFAIPASASAHEFERIEGNDNLGINLEINTDTGYQQLDYVKVAVEEMKAAGMENDVNFIGTAIWSWNEKTIWPPGGETLFYPEVPPADVLTYLSTNLPVGKAALAQGVVR